jgi:hypothetical protein
MPSDESDEAVGTTRLTTREGASEMNCEFVFGVGIGERPFRQCEGDV